MAHEYEHQRLTSEDGIEVADVYVVRDTTRQITPSPEFVTAIERLPPAAQAIMRRVLERGFQGLLRK